MQKLPNVSSIICQYSTMLLCFCYIYSIYFVELLFLCHPKGILGSFRGIFPCPPNDTGRQRTTAAGHGMQPAESRISQGGGIIATVGIIPQIFMQNNCNPPVLFIFTCEIYTFGVKWIKTS